MKQFEIPAFYRSPIISKVKAKRKLEDPRKQDFSPTKLPLENMEFILPRHFGFCYGVENAIEKSYKAIQENPGKRIFLLSQMIHNPAVNEDLQANGITFLQDTHGNELIPFSTLTSEDIVIIPAFGTTVEIEHALKTTGANITSYNTTCPFVEKVWNRSQKLGELEHTVIIHGKHDHEETRATFSHSHNSAPSLVIKNMKEAEFLGEVIAQRKSSEDFYQYFDGKYSQGFDPQVHLNKIGVVNQTTMLAIETQAITEYLRGIMKEVYGESALKERIADTRDTLCYATNDNQTSTYELAKSQPDFAVVVGGYNSSNTSHLVEILEETMPVFFITGEECISDDGEIHGFDIHELKEKRFRLPMDKRLVRIAITSGASCPDAVVDRVMLKLMEIYGEKGSFRKRNQCFAMKIYTKTGDDGTTGLIGGVRVSKADLQIESYGTVDELNSWVGLIRDTFNDDTCAKQLLEIQNNLFVLGASLATAPKGTKMQLPLVTSDFIHNLESWIDAMNTELPELTHFILPGGQTASSHAQIARCVCRRAERRVIELQHNDPRFSLEIQYLNRLSDYLFVLARFILQKFEKEEVKWMPDPKK